MIELNIAVPEWLIEKLAAIADVCEKTTEQVALSLFANEVVHTSGCMVSSPE